MSSTVCMYVFEKEKIRTASYIKRRQCAFPTGFGVLLAQGDQLLGQSLRLLGLGPCGCDGFMLEEGGDEVAEQSLSVRGLAAQMAELGSTSGHSVGGEGGLRMGVFSGGCVDEWDMLASRPGGGIGWIKSKRPKGIETSKGQWDIRSRRLFSLSFRGKDEAGDGDGGKIRFAA